HDPSCYLCPRGSRATGANNPDYERTFVFTNDYPALLPEVALSGGPYENGLLKWESASGTSRVICYSPRHDLTLPELGLAEIEAVISTWVDQARKLGNRYKWVQIFENKGQAMGASNPHPHGQVWAGDFIPTQMEKEDLTQRKYFIEHGSPLLADYARQELESKERIVCLNSDWIAVVPFWATWPFETLVLPLKPIHRMQDVKTLGSRSLADILKRLLTKYDHLFNVSFPYSMGWHGAPNIAGDPSAWQLHAHFFPPLLRSSTIKKFLVGYEMLGEAQRDITPETAAASLAALPDSYS
ncbi:MAG: UDP-glucose--hexose-1-phosphate uridylyltransferase, partial [FCB group bacterium]|nr:UDP-glucose--hexose-1-phosphate uridylyltransferase [FCB group bacterium]